MPLEADPQEKKWYVVYTKPRSEKRLAAYLKQRNIEAFLPVIRIRSKWSDRYKWIERPAFASYLFVRIHFDLQSLTVLRAPQAVSFIYCAAEPAMLQENEIETIRIAVEQFSDSLVIRNSSQFSPGQKVVVNFGPFAGKEGVVEKIQGKTLLVVSFPSLNKSLQVELPVENIRGPGEETLIS